MQTFAHITKVQGGYRFRESTDIRGQAVVAERFFETKKECRAYADRVGATPWNF